MTKQTMDMKYNFSQLFNAIGEKVYYDYSVEYDWKDIIENNFTTENFKIIPKGIDSNYDSYFNYYYIDKKKWEERMIQYLLSDENDITREIFLENIDNEEIKKYYEKW